MQTGAVHEKNFFLKGDLCWSSPTGELQTVANNFLLCLDGKCGGVFSEIPLQYAKLPVKDFSHRLIMPGLADLHTHAPQFSYRSLGMDMELLQWLEKKTFPEEAKYSSLEYARTAYTHFVEHIKRGPNTRLCIYATRHTPATLLLMEMLEASGLVTLVGKVNMDRNCPDYLREESAGASIKATTEWLDTFFDNFLEAKKDRSFKNTAPILTPRFIPSCTNELMQGIALLQKKYALAVQSHLSENRAEIAWVKELAPESENYSDAYFRYDLFGGKVPTVMAHCVWPQEKEIELLAKQNVYIAHCPQSNTNLSSGIAPVRRLLEAGVKVGLGSDIAGGASSSIFRAMSDAIQVSKLRQTLLAPTEKALTLEEAFFLGTAAGGSFFEAATQAANIHETNLQDNGEKKLAAFGRAGSFETGWDFDALVIDDSNLALNACSAQIRDRLERVVYLSDNTHIIEKYVRGVCVMQEYTK